MSNFCLASGKVQHHFMAGQPPPSVPPPTIRPYDQGLLTIGFSSIRPAIKPLFLGGGVRGPGGIGWLAIIIGVDGPGPGHLDGL